MQREMRSVKAGETDLGSGMFVKANMSGCCFRIGCANYGTDLRQWLRI